MEVESFFSSAETLAIASELRGKGCSGVAEFLNWKLAELEVSRKLEEGKYLGPNESGWGTLPDLILEKIFAYLSISERYYASCTCRQWYMAFYLQKPWQEFHMVDTAMCRRKYDYGEKSWKHVLDHFRTQQWITHVGQFLRRLTFTPTSFYGLFAHYHFMNHVSSYSERYEKDPDSPQACAFKIENLRFSFFCDIPNRAEQYIIGTGGDILGTLKRLMRNCKHLKRLDLIDLLLVPEDAIHLLDEACSVLCDKLRVLTLINATKDHFTMLHPACFVNLRYLYISPQNVGEESVDLMGNLVKLRELHLVQNSYSGLAVPVDSRCWYRVNHLFKVFLRTTSKTDKDMVWQERANVVSVIYDCPLTKFSDMAVVTVIDLYSESIREFGHLGLPKFRSSRKFVNRVDCQLLVLCRKCPYLTTLYVRDRISTSTALLIVSMSPNLRNFYLRRNAVLKKLDYAFHYNLCLDFNFTQWIKFNGKSYEKTTREIGQILGNHSWRLLTDKDFKTICSNCSAY